jgi:hypothetical protein
MIIKLASQVLKMQAEIDAKNAFVNSARKLENDILIQKQLKVISGLNQEMLYLNQSERLIDPAILEIAKSTISKNDFLTDPIIDSSKDENLLSKAGEQPAVIHIATDLAAEIKSPVTNETTTLQSLSSKPILAKIIEPNVKNLQPEAREHAAVIHVAADLTKSLAEMKPRVIEEDNSSQSHTSDLISEKFSELEIISENIESALFHYEDDFETGDESSSDIPILPASSSNTLQNSPEYGDLVTESIVNEILENAIDTSLKPKIGIPCPDLNPEPRIEAEISTQPICTFSSDMDQEVEILSNDTEDPTSNLISEKSSELEIISENLERFSQTSLNIARDEFLEVAGALKIDLEAFTELMKKSCWLHYNNMDLTKRERVPFEIFLDRVAATVFKTFLDWDNGETLLEFEALYSRKQQQIILCLISASMAFEDLFGEEGMEALEAPAEIKKRRRRT